MNNDLLLPDLGEDALVTRLTALIPSDPMVLVGPGDDCAVVTDEHDSRILLKTDVIVEGIHFLRGADPFLIGRKALARGISDMAAMAGTAQHALVTMVLPDDLSVSEVEAMFKGLLEVGQEFGVSVVGGETSRGPVIMISVALSGFCIEEPVLRSGGQPGDRLWVTGRLGGSIHGHHFRFVPRIKEAAWLASGFRPNAMMDLSDGLAADLPRLAQASGCGWRVELDALPCTADCSPQQAWADGEDYELLFATSPEMEADLKAAWSHRFPEVPLTAIGWLDFEGVTTGQAGGWDHFRRS
jgi:thiamine-monophosphate kinase